MWKFFECFVNWRVPPDSDGELAKADVVVTHAFGGTDEPSSTTCAIVELGIELADRFNLPMVCQYPGSGHALSYGVDVACVIREHSRTKGKYVDTDEVNHQVRTQCDRHGWRTAILIAHPHHLWRARMNLAKHDIKVLVPDTSGISYDQESEWRNLRWPWFPLWDFLARMKYFWDGLI